MTNRASFPHSICCLRAIEQYVGGRKKLAEKMDVSEATICRWVAVRKIPRGSILKLQKLSDDKFSANELLGQFDGKTK